MKPVEVTPMKTLSECVNSLTTQGYTENFQVKSNRLIGADESKAYSKDKVHIVNFYRFEGQSDPADNAILYAIETADGTKGILVDAYGSAADASISDFIRQVTDINKVTEK